MRVLLVLCLLITTRAQADRALEKAPVSLLGGRLALRLPVGMELASAQVDPTSAELELHDGRFVMTAYETYQRVGTELRAGVLAELRRQGGSLAHARVIRAELAGLSAVTVHPPLRRAGADPNLVLAVYVASSDDTVQVIGFYVTGGAREAASEWAALAERITQTITAGTAELRGYAGLLSVAGRRLRIACGADCVVLRSGSGYQVRPLVRLGRTQLCTLDEGPAIARPRAVHRPAQLLGKSVVWTEWRDIHGAHASTSVPLDGPDDLRIACDATTRGELDAVRAVVETMTLDD